MLFSFSLIMQKEMTPGLPERCEKARGIVWRYKHSPKGQERLNCCQKKTNQLALSVVQDVETVWDGECAVMSGLLEIREAITIDLAFEDGYSEGFTGTEQAVLRLAYWKNVFLRVLPFLQ